MDQPRWMSFFEQAPVNEYQRRPLPPLPPPEYENPAYKHHETNNEIQTNAKRGEKAKRHNGHSGNGGPNRKRNRNTPGLETSVMLTVSIRNEKQAKRLKNIQNGLPEISVIHNNRPVSTSSNDESENLKNNLMAAKPRRRRRRKSACILPMVVLTAVILAGLITAVTVIFLTPQEGSSDEKDNGGFAMVLGHVEMRTLNKVYDIEMINNGSSVFTSFTIPLCQQVDNLFLTSKYGDIYYGCTVKRLKNGSIVSFKDLIFKEEQHLKNLKNPLSIQSVIETASPAFQYDGNTAIQLGDYVVDRHSIKVTIETFKTHNLPKKPNLHNTVTSTAPETNNYSTVSPSPSKSKSTSPGPTKVFTIPSTPTSTTTETPALPPTSDVSSQSTGIPLTTEDTVISLATTQKITTESRTAIESTSKTIPSHNISTAPPIYSYVRMTNREAYTHDHNVAMTCTVGRFEQWKYITFHFQSRVNPDITLLNVSYTGAADFPNPSTARRLIVDIKLGSRSAIVSLNFTEVHCQDEGIYSCTTYSPNLQMTGTGALRIKERPTTPILTMPVEMVEDREISQPIRCTANIGYPQGTLHWKIRPKGYNQFLPFEDAKVTTSGQCNNIVSSTIVYTPTLEGNGTVLKCEVSNAHVTTTDELYSTAVVNIVRGDICRGREYNVTLKHPYVCDKYVQCLNKTFKIYQCPNELCYNPQTGRCGQTGLTMTNDVAYMNERVTSITCRLLHMGFWGSISIWKVLETHEKVNLLIITNDTHSHLQNTTMRRRIFADVQLTKNEVDVKLWIYNLECGDDGMYECRADVPFDVSVAQGNISLRVKPKTPHIFVPAEIIDGRSLRERFTCIGDVGYPHGTLKWQMRYENETDFKPVHFKETVSEVEGNCSLEVTREFVFTPTKKENGMVIRCVVENRHSLPQGQILYTSLPIHVIPANFCTPGNSNPVAHPYDCRHYVHCTEGYTYVQRCSQGLCFNPESLQCDIPEPVETEIVDPNHPCKPNRNGVYFPHPFLCNKYIWCVQGKEIIRHCPLGTLYLSEGQCTFNTANSHCFRSDTNSTTKP